jgi:hypothetical protein
VATALADSGVKATTETCEVADHAAVVVAVLGMTMVLRGAVGLGAR